MIKIKSISKRKKVIKKDKDSKEGSKLKKVIKKNNLKDLMEYNWGMGIEHEMHIFHKPMNKNNANINDYIAFNSQEVIERILDNRNNTKGITYDDYLFIKNNVPYEVSGRKCNNKFVVKPIKFQMPEFITSNPFCSIGKNRNLLNMTYEIKYAKERFYRIIMNDDKTRKLVKEYGELYEYPFGMSRYIKEPIKEIKGKYIFEKNKQSKLKLNTDYLGSYHVTMTLPYKPTISLKNFIKMHQNFANQLQWLEPLMLTAYFSTDEYAPGKLNDYPRSGYRPCIIGWGNMAGSDVRLFNKGIGRYAKTPTYWRDNKLNFKETDKLKPCYPASPMAKRENAITSLSSDFRTFGENPNNPSERLSGAPMTVGNGIEFRIFDHFSDKYIEHLMVLIGLVAENSRVKETKGYVYQNPIWIASLHNIIKNGYRAQLSKKYIELLRIKLGIPIKTDSIIAIDVFKKVYNELWDKNINGKWSKIFYAMELPNKENIIIPEINKKSWQFAFMTKLNRNKNLLRKFNILSKYLNKVNHIKFVDFEKAVIDIFGNMWKDDIVDIAYFYNSMATYELKKSVVDLIKNKNGTIKSIKVNQKIHIFNNFNSMIIDYFGSSVLENILSKKL
jgi:hypothetical protein